MMFTLRSFCIAFLAIAASIANARTVKDEVAQLSIEVPEDAQTKQDGNENGHGVMIHFNDKARREDVTVAAIQATNNGSPESASMKEFKQMVGSMTDGMHRPATSEPHAVTYRNTTLYVVSFAGVGRRNDQTYTALVTFQTSPATRWLQKIELITAGFQGPSDESLLTRLAQLHYQPFLH